MNESILDKLAANSSLCIRSRMTSVCNQVSNTKAISRRQSCYLHSPSRSQEIGDSRLYSFETIKSDELQYQISHIKLDKELWIWVRLYQEMFELVCIEKRFHCHDLTNKTSIYEQTCTKTKKLSNEFNKWNWIDSCLRRKLNCWCMFERE